MGNFTSLETELDNPLIFVKLYLDESFVVYKIFVILGLGTCQLYVCFLASSNDYSVLSLIHLIVT